MVRRGRDRDLNEGPSTVLFRSGPRSRLSASSRTPFKALAELCERLVEASGRNEKKALIFSFLRTLHPSEIPPAVLLLVGSIFPEQASQPLEVGYRTLSRASSQAAQRRLTDRSLTILDVRAHLEKIAGASGRGSKKRREELLESLMSRADDLERKWMVKSVYGEMQHGVGEGLMLEAVAEAVDVEIEAVRRAHMFLGDLGETARLALTEGVSRLRAVSLTLFRPVKPMLAEMAYSVEEALQEGGAPLAFEYKFDGARVQVHKKGQGVRVFSRRLSDVTESLPDVVSLVRGSATAQACVFDGEVIAVNGEDRPLPFQDLMRRFRRKRGVERAREEVPVRLYLFDILYVDGRLLVDEPYSKRWEELSKTKGAIGAAPMIVTSSVDEAQRFMEESLAAGHEGLMAKALDSPYRPGSRGNMWFKVKPAETLDLAIVAADWGYGRRTGWLSDYYLAALDESSGEFSLVGKTFKGLTDEEFEWITRRLQELKVSEDEHAVYVRPSIVVEVAFGEVQKSPRYKSGLALRFARITRIRDEKTPEEVDTIGKVRELYERQFRSKGRLG